MKDKEIDVTYTIKGGVELLLVEKDPEARPSGLKSSSLAHLSKKEAQALKDKLEGALRFYDDPECGAIRHPED